MDNLLLKELIKGVIKGFAERFGITKIWSSLAPHWRLVSMAVCLVVALVISIAFGDDLRLLARNFIVNQR